MLLIVFDVIDIDLIYKEKRKYNEFVFHYLFYSRNNTYVSHIESIIF